MSSDSDPRPPRGGSSTLAGLLRALREGALLTQEQLADRAGLHVRTIRWLESGRIQRPRSTTLRLLADALHLGGPERAALAAATRNELVDPAPASDVRTASPPGAPDPTAGRLIPAQLPMDVASFTGRSGDLAQLDALLPDGQAGQPVAVPLAAIAGAAGVGKTALAVHWAHRVGERFADGQLFVNLRGWTTGAPLRPLQALALLLHGLGVEPERVPVEEDQAAGLYRSLLAGKRVLIVLDNARDAAQVRPLLPGSPGCLAVVTSRDRLTGLVASHGARRLRLDVLSPEEAVTLLARILGQERVVSEHQATRELAEICGMLPLTLRIAAANLAGHPQHSIADYVAGLGAGDRLAELAVDDDPHTAVRTAFDTSYATLAPGARRLFRLLGLVPGPDFSAPAAAALAGTAPGQAVRLLERLAGAHLLEPRGLGRYALHDLLRLYAAQCSQDEDAQAERQAALGRLLDHYLHATDAAARLLYPEMVRLPLPAGEVGLPTVEFDDQAGALAWLDAERTNLVAALQHAVEHGLLPLAWLLADLLRGYFMLRRHTVDWLTVAHAAMAATASADDPRAQAAAHLNLGDAHWSLGRYAHAIEHYTTALDLACQTGWTDGQATILGNLGTVHWELGRLEQAADHHTRALALNRQTGRLAGQANNLLNLGAVDRVMGRLHQATDHYTQALALYRQLGSPAGEATTLANLGEVEHDLGRLDHAAEQLTRAVTLMLEVGDRYGEAYALDVLAAVHRDTGRHTHALELAQAALARAREIGDRRCEAEALNILGSVHLRLGRGPQALDHHQQALDLARETGTRYAETESLLGLAAAHQHTGQHAQAIAYAEQALDIAGQDGYQILEGHARIVLARLHLAQDQADQAIEQIQQALALHRRSGHRLGQARALLVVGHALRSSDGARAATACWQEALELFTDIGTSEAAHVRSLLDELVPNTR